MTHQRDNASVHLATQGRDVKINAPLVLMVETAVNDAAASMGASATTSVGHVGVSQASRGIPARPACVLTISTG